MSGTPSAESDAALGPWIPINQGFLCDPHFMMGEVVIRDQIAYWDSALGGTFVLDLTEAAVTEAARRNRRARVIPPA